MNTYAGPPEEIRSAPRRPRVRGAGGGLGGIAERVDRVEDPLGLGRVRGWDQVPNGRLQALESGAHGAPVPERLQRGERALHRPEAEGDGPAPPHVGREVGLEGHGLRQRRECGVEARDRPLSAQRLPDQPPQCSDCDPHTDARKYAPVTRGDPRCDPNPADI